jgi:hypothetical protein
MDSSRQQWLKETFFCFDACVADGCLRGNLGSLKCLRNLYSESFSETIEKIYKAHGSLHVSGSTSRNFVIYVEVIAYAHPSSDTYLYIVNFQPPFIPHPYNPF